MKEYICKDDLSEKVQGRVIFTHEIDELPTVTKADICREFADIFTEKANDMWNEEDARNFHTDLMNILDMVLAEMERE